MAAKIHDIHKHFWTRVEKTDACWLWRGKLSDGYGRYHTGHRAGYECQAHRFAWEEINGIIPRTYELDHMCKTRHCVNPGHLQRVPRGWNGKQGASVGSGVFNAEKTHCPQGHAYTQENTYVHGSKRFCRTCNNESSKQRRNKVANR